MAISFLTLVKNKIAPKTVVREIEGFGEVEFYPLTTSDLQTVYSVGGDFAKALALLWTATNDDARKRDVAQTSSTVAASPEQQTVASYNTHTDSIEPDLAALRAEQASEGLEKALKILLSPDTGLLVAGIVLRSMRASDAEDMEARIAVLDQPVAVLIDLLQGVMSASQEAFKRMGKGFKSALAASVAEAVNQQQKTEEAETQPTT